MEELKRLTQNAYAELSNIKETLAQSNAANPPFSRATLFESHQRTSHQAARRLLPFRPNSVSDGTKPAKSTWEASVHYTAAMSKTQNPDGARVTHTESTGPHMSLRLEHKWPGNRGGASATLAASVPPVTKSDDLAATTESSLKIVKTEVTWKSRGLTFQLAGGRCRPGDVLVRTECSLGHGYSVDVKEGCALSRPGTVADPRAVVAAVIKGDATVGLQGGMEGDLGLTAFAQAVLKPTDAITLGVIGQRPVYSKTEGGVPASAPLDAAVHSSVKIGDRVAISGWVHHNSQSPHVHWNVSSASTEGMSRWGWGIAMGGGGPTAVDASDIQAEFHLRWRPADGVSINPGIAATLHNHERFENPRMFVQMRWDLC